MAILIYTRSSNNTILSCLCSAENPTLNFDDSDEFLIIFLRPCKYYAESAFKLMQRVAEFRKKNADILKGVSPLAEKDTLLNTQVLNVLVDRDQHRRRIMVLNVGKVWDPKKLNTDQLFRSLYLIHFGAMLEPVTQIHGSIIIMDFTGLTTKQATAFTPAFSFRLLDFIQNAMPLRLKAVHIVFQPFIFNLIWTIFKPFIQQKLNKRIFLHGNKIKTLHEHVSPKCLPEEYGGDLAKIDYSSADWYPILEALNDEITILHSYGYKKEDK